MWFKRIFYWCYLILVYTLSPSQQQRLENSEQCSWQMPTNEESNTKLTVTCNVRLLERHSNFTNAPQEYASKLNIACSNNLFFESNLPTSLENFQQLEELTITSCKVLTIDPKSFQGLSNLKKLTINTRNSHWGPTRTMELFQDSLEDLRELQILDLGDSNLKLVPDNLFCPMQNLLTLNLTRNSLRDVPNVCGSSELQILDLSYNRIDALGENSGFSKLRRLQELNLQSNLINTISGESFTGLVSLKQIDLSDNRLSELPQGLFAGSPELKEIHLQNNSMSLLGKGLFHRLEQLLVLDLSGNQLTSTHVDHNTFQGLIRLIVLNLSHNALTRIDTRTFKDLYFLQILDLKNNSIGFIEDDAFLPLYNLHTLNLAENRLNTIGPQLFNGLFVLSKLTLNNNLIVTVDPRAFQNCSALKELDLSSNALAEVPEAVQELTFLKTLDLGENQIGDFKNGSFRNLNQLTGLRLIDNVIGNLTRGMLWDLPNLQVLNLAKNKIQSIERGTFERNSLIEAIRLDENFLTDINGVFATLTSLLWLNLSENHLVWFDYAFIPSNLKWLDVHGNFIEHLGNYYKIQDEIGVKTLDASHNRITELSPMSIPNSVELLFVNNNFIKKLHTNTFLAKANLARVDMYSNDLINIDLNALRLTPVPTNRSLPEFYLGGNPFHCDCSMEWLQVMNSMSGSRQYPRIMDSDNVVCKLTHSKAVTHLPLTQIKPKDFLCTYETHCFTLCHCCDFDACDCEMTCPNNCSCYHDQTWNTNVVDCSLLNAREIPQRIPMDATEVYLDGNDIRELQNHAFIGRKNLKVLFVNNSNVQTIQNSTFNSLHSLEKLHLQDNKLRHLKGYEFEHLDHLKELFLQNNLLESIGNDTFSTLTSLEVVRLDGNRLTKFPVWVINSQKLLISENPWSCRCEFLQSLTEWLRESASTKIGDRQALSCTIQGSSPRPLDMDTCEDSPLVSSLLVNDYWHIVVTILCLASLILIAAILGFLFKKPLKLWLYSRYGASFTEDNKLYDAFVCYSPKDEEWVVQSLANQLEPNCQLCLHYRDLIGSSFSHSIILEAAEASRRVLIVLTRNFLETEWGRFDLRQAFHEMLKGRMFKLVIVEESDLDDSFDPELRLLVRSAQRIKWGDRKFWDKLKSNLLNPNPNEKVGNQINYRRNINNYTIDSTRMGNAPLEKVLMSPPPAYSQEMEDPNNYSSATTATPSPRPSRRAYHHHPHDHQESNRPVSDHIYSSIDSDYSTLERGGSGARRMMAMGVVQAQHHPNQWRSSQNVIGNCNNNGGGQAYLV